MSENGKLTRDTIVAAAVRLADAEGLSALSMRRIADALNVGTMSLYRHIADKDALISAMVEAVGLDFGYPEHLRGQDDWRASVHVAADVDWSMYHRHPWIMFAFATPRHSMGQQSLICLDWLMAAFTPITETAAERAEMAFIVWNYISGIALGALADPLHLDGDDAAKEGGWTALLDGSPLHQVPAGMVDLVGAGRIPEISEAKMMLDRGVDDLCNGFERRRDL